MDGLETIFAVFIIIFGFIKMILKNQPAEEETEAEETEETGTGDEQGEAAPQFAYYTDRQGMKRVDVNESNRLSGRELTEYEIFDENKRLEAEFAESMPDIPEKPRWAEVQPPEYGEEISLEELSRKPAFDSPEEPGVRSDKEYQLEQLERWLDAGLIDKAEYRRRKREMK